MKSLKLSYFLALLLFVTITNAQVGIGVATPNVSAQLEVSATNKGFLPPRMDSVARNTIASPAIGLTIYNTSSKAFECFNGTNWYSTVHYVGEKYGGGIVFYVYDNGQHGLIASTTDQGTNVQWYNGTIRHTGSQGDGVNSGSMNTTMIVAAQLSDNPTGIYAAKLCAEYSVTNNGNTFGGWYLPSKEELNLLYLNQNIVGGFNTTKDYWSSTEFGSITAYYQFFGNGGLQGNDPKSNSTASVRAIRAF